MINLDSKIIDKYLKNNLDIIYNHFNSNIYLLGGSIKDLLLGNSPRDIDIIVLCDNDREIKSLIEKYKIEYVKNHFNGYKLKYNNLEIDIWNTNDFYKCIQYNFDGLFYDIKNKIFLPFGFYDTLESKNLKEINPNITKNRTTQDLEKEKNRKEKAKILIKKLGEFNE